MAHAEGLLQRIDHLGHDQQHPLSVCARIIRHARDPHVRALTELFANELYQDNGDLAAVEQLFAKAHPLMTTMGREEVIEKISSAVLAQGLEESYNCALEKLPFDIRSEVQEILKRCKG